MRRVLLLVLFAVVMSVPAAGAEKIITDPNAPGAASVKSAPIDNSDKRLEKKVTYEATQKRLHTIIDDLSKMTGVTIRSGKNNKDWQTRDLPLTICVKDMPLGELLSSLCDAAHLVISSELSVSTQSPSRIYRLLSDDKYRKQRDEHIAAYRREREALNSWAWDTLIKADSIPDLENALQQNKRVQGDCDPKVIRAISSVLSELGPQAKEKLISGRRIDISPSASSNPDVIFELFQLAYNKSKPDGAPEPVMSDMDMSTINLVNNQSAETGYSSISIAVASIQYKAPSNITTSWTEDLPSIAQVLYEKLGGKGLPPKPEEVEAMWRPFDSINSSLEPISIEPDFRAYTRYRRPGEKLKVFRDGKLVEAAPEWKSALLQKIVKMDLPNDRDISYADVLIAAAKSADINIVTEDFVSHKDKYCFQLDKSKEAYLNPVKEYVGQETPLGNILGTITRSPRNETNFEFYIDDKEKLVLGRSYEWTNRHNNLLPEALIVDLQSKANKNGLDIDDVAQLIQYTSQQHQEWLWTSPDLSMLTMTPNNSSHNFDDIFWRFYASLTPKDRAQAKLETGLPFAQFVASGCCDFFRSERELDSTIYSIGYGSANDKLQADNKEQNKHNTLTDPDILRNLVLYIRVKPVSMWCTYSSTGGSSSSSGTNVIPDYAKDRHTYAATIEGDAGGKQIKVELDNLRSAFPLYSPAKEKHLEEQWKKEHTK